MLLERYPSASTSRLNPMSTSLDGSCRRGNAPSLGGSVTTVTPSRAAIAGISPRTLSMMLETAHHTMPSSLPIRSESLGQCRVSETYSPLGSMSTQMSEAPISPASVLSLKSGLRIFPALRSQLSRTSAGALLRSSQISNSLTRPASGLRDSSNRSPLKPISNAMPSMASDMIPETVSTILSDTAFLSGYCSSLSISGISSENLLQTVSTRSRKQWENLGNASEPSQSSRISLKSPSSGSFSTALLRYGIASGSRSMSQ